MKKSVLTRLRCEREERAARGEAEIREPYLATLRVSRRESGAECVRGLQLTAHRHRDQISRSQLPTNWHYFVCNLIFQGVAFTTGLLVQG